MELHVGFQFRGEEHSCCAIIDSSEYPCYIFALLTSPALISEFGNDLTIATDGKNRLAKKEDYAALAELSDAILNVIKEANEFRFVKLKMKILSQRILEA